MRPALEIARLPGESLAGIWTRRAVSIPLLAAGALVAGAGAPLLFALACIADLARGAGRRLPAVRCVAFFTLFLVTGFVGLLAAGALWLVALGGRMGGAAAYIRHNAALQRAWSGALFHGGSRLFGMHVTLEGDRVPDAGPLLVFVRHASTADTLLAAAFVANPRRILLRYVLKRELLWDSCLDVVGRRLPNAFVDRSGAAREREVGAVAGLARGLGPRDGVLIYPEGTRFSESKRARAIDDLRARGHDDLAQAAERLEHTLLPRPGGALALLGAAPGADVLLVEHQGFEAAAHFGRFWRGDLIGARVRIRMRRFAAASIPAGDRYAWLLARWAEMDAWIARAAGGAS